MSQQELLKKTLHALNERDFPYMLTGSIVSSIQGEPRLSHDIDIIISGTHRILNILRDHFSETEYYFDATAIEEAIASQHMFNVIDINSGDKIDFWLLTDSAFDESRFARKIKISLFETWAWISTPEDTILAKLLWAKKSGGSGKQILDVQRVYEVNASRLDKKYIEQWCTTLGVIDYWNSVLHDAEVF
jgi:hypothetical protein